MWTGLWCAKLGYFGTLLHVHHRWRDSACDMAFPELHSCAQQVCWCVQAVSSLKTFVLATCNRWSYLIVGFWRHFDPLIQKHSVMACLLILTLKARHPKVPKVKRIYKNDFFEFWERRDTLGTRHNPHLWYSKFATNDFVLEWLSDGVRLHRSQQECSWLHKVYIDSVLCWFCVSWIRFECATYTRVVFLNGRQIGMFSCPRMN